MRRPFLVSAMWLGAACIVRFELEMHVAFIYWTKGIFSSNNAPMKPNHSLNKDIKNENS